MFLESFEWVSLESFGVGVLGGIEWVSLESIMSEASTALGVAEASLSNTPVLDFAKEMISKIGGDHLTKISSGISREFGDNSVDTLSRTLDFTSESIKVGVGSLIKSTPSNKDAFQGIQVYEVSGRLDAYDKRVGIEEK